MPLGCLSTAGAVTDYAGGRALTPKSWIFADNLLLHSDSPIFPAVVSNAWRIRSTI